MHPAVAAVAGWAFPGLGYWLIGERARAITVGATILMLFFGGILIAGIRSIDVPGYSESGRRVPVVVRQTRMGTIEKRIDVDSNEEIDRSDYNVQWALTKHPVQEVLNKPWYIGQILAGPVTIICSKLSLDLSQPVEKGQGPRAPKSHVRVAEIGTLYSAIAGMLNLLVIIDAAHRASKRNAAAGVTA